MGLVSIPGGISSAPVNANQGVEMSQSGFKYAVIAAAALALPLVMNASPAHAFNYGKKLPNGKTCRVVFGETHLHGGDGTDASRAAAEARAIQRWSRFVSFEYGRKYGKWAAAEKQAMRCAHDTGKGVWRCRADAQPCKS